MARAIEGPLWGVVLGALAPFAAASLALTSWVGCSDWDSAIAAGDRPCGVVAIGFDAPLEGMVDRLEVRAQLGSGIGPGETLVAETIATDGRDPIEVPLPSLEPGTRVTVSVEAYDGDALVLRQIASTESQAGRTLLLPVRLNDECVPELADRDVSCISSTCRAGVCMLPYLEPRDLADYAPDWAEPPEGRCGAVDDGEPEVVLGEPGESFVLLEEGQVLRPYRGAQGGMHFFYGVRMRGAHEVTAVTHHFAKVLSTGRESSVVTIAEPYEVDEDGCHRFDVPWILPPVDVVGEPMRLEVTVTDVTGNAGHGHAVIVVGEPIGDD